jgi:hypothetical protein
MELPTSDGIEEKIIILKHLGEAPGSKMAVL